MIEDTGCRNREAEGRERGTVLVVALARERLWLLEITSMAITIESGLSYSARIKGASRDKNRPVSRGSKLPEARKQRYRAHGTIL
jgi:hypothetical protein